MNIREDERMKPENWIPLGWLPIVDSALRRGMKLVQPVIADCFTNAGNIFCQIGICSLQNIGLSYIPMESPGKTMHFITGLLGDQQVYLFYLFDLEYLSVLRRLSGLWTDNILSSLS
jgi:hypothetical protein